MGGGSPILGPSSVSRSTRGRSRTLPPGAAALATAVCGPPLTPAPALPDTAAAAVALAALDRVVRKCWSIASSRPDAISSSTHGMTATAALGCWGRQGGSGGVHGVAEGHGHEQDQQRGPRVEPRPPARPAQR